MIQNSWGKAAFSFIAKEIVLRGSLQEIFSMGGEKILPKKDVGVFSRSIALITLVAIVATSILFGIGNFLMGDSLLYVVFTTLSSISYGILAVQYGFTGSDVLHRIQVLKRDAINKPQN